MSRHHGEGSSNVYSVKHLMYCEDKMTFLCTSWHFWDLWCLVLKFLQHSWDEWYFQSILLAWRQFSHGHGGVAGPAVDSLYPRESTAVPWYQLLGMRVVGLDSNWGILPWTTAFNPTCSWPPQCRIVLLIASARLQVFSPLSLFLFLLLSPSFSLSIGNIQKLYSVSRSDKRFNLIFFLTHSSSPTSQILLCCTDTAEIQ